MLLGFLLWLFWAVSFADGRNFWWVPSASLHFSVFYAILIWNGAHDNSFYLLIQDNLMAMTMVLLQPGWSPLSLSCIIAYFWNLNDLGGQFGWWWRWNHWYDPQPRLVHWQILENSLLLRLRVWWMGTWGDGLSDMGKISLIGPLLVELRWIKV